MSGRKYLTGMVFLSILFFGTVLFAGEWCYYIQDHLGNTRVVLDNTGKVKEYYDYEPYGKSLRENIAGEDKAIYKFTGKELDEEGSLNWYYFGARYYDAELGRWLSVDPAAGKYPSLSPYVYCNNNPMIFIDAHGDSVAIRDNVSLEALRKALTPEDAKYIKTNNRGMIIVEELAKANSSDENLKALKELVTSEKVYEVSSGKGFYYKGEDGKIHYLSFGGKANGTEGFTGYTLAPDNSGTSSTNNNVQVIINAQNTELGRSLAISHELFGHALLYNRNESWMHNYTWERDLTGYGFHTVERNIMLLNLILNGRTTTIRNFNLWH